MPAGLAPRTLTLAAVLLLLQGAHAQNGPVCPEPGPCDGIAMAPAPRVRTLDVGPPVDLGTWDDTYLLPEPGLLLVRRGSVR